MTSSPLLPPGLPRLGPETEVTGAELDRMAELALGPTADGGTWHVSEGLLCLPRHP